MRDAVASQGLQESQGHSNASREEWLRAARRRQLRQTIPYGLTGSICRLSGLAVSATDLPAPLGAWCEIDRGSATPLRGEVVGFRDHETVLLCESELDGVRRGGAVRMIRSHPTLAIGPGLLGRVLNGSGRIIDGGPLPYLSQRIPFSPPATPPLDRPRIETPLATGVRALDAFLTCGVGQRMGLFAGSGVGKSVLLGQIARHSSADVNVVVLVGERGREVREFVEQNLGSSGLARSVVVTSTSEESPLLRRRAACVGAAIAGAFRDAGRNVLLMVDSITRLALAQREIGLAAGEPPATRGYPPSVFAWLSRILERSGRTSRGSITGLYTVLVEGDDPHEPIADAVRGTLDGHVCLSRRLAEQGCFPAIDILASLSRVMAEIVSPEHLRAAATVRAVLAAHRQAEDLISIGAYQPGSQPRVDVALAREHDLERFLRQDRSDWSRWEETQCQLLNLAQKCRDL